MPATLDADTYEFHWLDSAEEADVFIFAWLPFVTRNNTTGAVQEAGEREASERGPWEILGDAADQGDWAEEDLDFDPSKFADLFIFAELSYVHDLEDLHEFAWDENKHPRDRGRFAEKETDWHYSAGEASVLANRAEADSGEVGNFITGWRARRISRKGAYASAFARAQATAANTQHEFFAKGPTVEGLAKLTESSNNAIDAHDQAAGIHKRAFEIHAAMKSHATAEHHRHLADLHKQLAAEIFKSRAKATAAFTRSSQNVDLLDKLP